MKVFLYERVSSEEQVKHGYSLDAQDLALKAFCEANDHVVLGIYRDEGISARKPYTKRPAMVQLLEDLSVVKPDIVLFTKLDRWFRNIKEYYKVQDILDKNKVYWKAINEEYDTSTASGRLYVNIKLSIAQDEADRTSERIKDIQDQLILQGKVLGGSVPFGYKIKDKRIVFGENIDIVRQIIKHYTTYQSAHATARYINDLHRLSFNHTRLIRLLRSPILKGEYRFNTDYCEPLITAEEWDNLQEIIDRNIKRSPRSRIYLFSGLIKCPYCGRNLGSLYDGSRYYYRCNRHYNNKCEMPHHVSEKIVETWLLKNVEEDFKVNVTMKPKKKADDPKKYKDRLKRLNDMYLLGNITNEEYKEKSKDLQKIIADLSKEPKVKEVKFSADWKEVYEKLDREHRRAFWRRLIKEVKIDKDGMPVEILY